MRSALLIVAALLPALLPACSLIVDPQLDPMRVGFIYETHSWPRELDRARASIEEKLGVETHADSAASREDTAELVDRFIAEDDAMIIGGLAETSAVFVERANSAKLVLANSTLSAPTLGAFAAREYQAIYAAGRLAAQLVPADEDVDLGVLGAIATPEMVRMVNAYARGARSVAANAHVYPKWIGSMSDPALEASLTEELLEGPVEVDVLLVLAPSDTAMRTAQAIGDVMVIAVGDREACALAPDVCLTSIYWNWGPLVERIVRDAEEQSPWTPPKAWEPMRIDSPDSAVGLAYSVLGDRVIERVNPRLISSRDAASLDRMLTELSADSFEARYTPFLPPIMDNAHTARMDVGADAARIDAELTTMCWFVEGVFEAPASIEGDFDIPAKVPAACGGGA